MKVVAPLMIHMVKCAFQIKKKHECKSNNAMGNWNKIFSSAWTVLMQMWIEQKYIYSQTCPNNHFCKMTTHLRWPMLSPPRQIPMQPLLYKTTTCPTRPATTFFVPQMKKAVQNSNCKTFSSGEMGSNTYKILISLIIFTLLLLYNAQFV